MGEAVPHEEPRRLSDFLRERRDDILASWEVDVRRLRAARNLDRPLLLDHMPQFIEDLAGYVADVRAGIDAPAPEEHPRIHALERLEVGYDLSEVVHEYAMLRECITRLAVGSPPVRSAELPRLHRAIDHAIATSVMRYTEARERTMRALDRISSAALVDQDVQSLLPRTLAAFLDTTASVDSVALALREEGGLDVRVAFGFPTGPRGTLPADSFGAAVERRGAPIFVRDATHDHAQDVLVAPGTHALYGVPLIVGERVNGVAVMGSRTSWEFSQEDQFLFRTMVNRATALLEQARLHAEVAHRAAELESVIDAIPEGVVVGDERGVRISNRSMLELYGVDSIEELSREILAGSPAMVSRRLDGTPLPRDERPYWRALKQGHRAVQDILTRRADGEDRALRISAAPIRVQGKVVGAVAVHTDITGRVTEEEELRAALEFRNRILGVLSHDVRNPLSVILTSATLLQRKATYEVRPIERIIASANSIERMVRDLLDYTRARQGRTIPLQTRDVDLLQLCHEVVDAVQVLHPERSIRLSASGDTHARLDPDRTAQVVTNLVTNAVRYGAPDAPVLVTLTGSPAELLLEVHNLGPPIPPEVLPHVFEAFRRGLSDDGRSGLGLGLWIVEQIVAAHGGRVEAQSGEEGTTFRVHFPRSDVH